MEGRCEDCGKATERIEEHHVSYLPAVKKFLCSRCHHKIKTYQARFARIRYSCKGIITPSNTPKNIHDYYYNEKKDKAYPMFRELTKREKMIRKEMIKEERIWKVNERNGLRSGE
jgi:hypothetical protein